MLCLCSVSVAPLFCYFLEPDRFLRLGNLQAPWALSIILFWLAKMLLADILLAYYEAFGIPLKNCIPTLVNGAMTGKMRDKNLSLLWVVALKLETDLHFIEACDFGKDFERTLEN